MKQTFRLDKPYPKVVSDGDDFYQVKCIMPDYGGKYGELTSVTQYIYYSYICTANNDNELSEIFHGVAIAEMMHHRFLGDAITTLGGNPIIGDEHNYWTGSYIPYNMIREQMLNLAIEWEQYAIDSYTQSIACTTNNSLKQLFARIIEDEQYHIEIFTAQLKGGNWQ